jgi:hypothetical protein
VSVQPRGVNNSNMTTGIFINDNGGGDGFFTVYGYPYEIYGFTFGINDHNQICGRFDIDGTQVGFTAQLPLQPTGP